MKGWKRNALGSSAGPGYRGARGPRKPLATLPDSRSRAPRAEGLVGLAVAAALVSCARDSEPVASAESPPRHVLLVVVDTLRADHLGCYGYSRNTSPRIDGLATQGVRFERCVSQAPWTTPSIGALVTSRYPRALGIETEESRLGEEWFLLSEALQRHGFATGAVVSHSFCSSEWNFHQGFDEFDESNVLGHDAVTSESVSNLAIEFVDRHRDDRFFLWLHYFDPHFSYIEHPQFPFHGKGDYDGPVQSGMKFRRLREMAADLDSEDLAEVRRLYDSEIAYTDYHLGRVFDRLKDHGLWEDTMIVFVGDHGEEFLEHGDLGHARTLYEELLHVPLIVRIPGRMAGVMSFPVAVLDVYPTVLNALQLPLPSMEALQGRDLFGETDFRQRPVISETQRRRNLRSVVQGDFKLVRQVGSGQVTLFQLPQDPDEQEDVSDEFPAIRDHLLELLEEFESIEYRPASMIQIPEEDRERLEALGYLEDG